MPSYFPENNSPKADDTEVRSLQKINDLLSGGITVSVGEVEVKNDSGNPVPVNGTVTAIPTKDVVSQAVTQSITTGGTSQQIFAANSSRKYLLVQNLSDADMYLGLGFTPSDTTPTGILLSKNGGGIVFEESFIATSNVNIICATTGKKFAAIQG